MWQKRKVLLIVLLFLAAICLAATRLAWPQGGARTIPVGRDPRAVAVASSEGHAQQSSDTGSVSILPED